MQQKYNCIHLKGKVSNIVRVDLDNFLENIFDLILQVSVIKAIKLSHKIINGSK